MQGIKPRLFSWVFWIFLSLCFGLNYGFALKTKSICPPPVFEAETKINEKNCRFEKNDENLICDGEFSFWNPSQMPNVLTSLRINGTKLKNLPACSFFSFSINTIIIEENINLTKIDANTFVGVKNLTRLIIKKNSKLDLPNLFRILSGLSDLKELVLDENLISSSKNDSYDEVMEDFDAHLDSLEIISLFGNQLETISIGFFKPIKNSPIKELILQDCSIQTVEPGSLLQLETLRRIDLSKNPKLLADEDDDTTHHSSKPNAPWTTVILSNNNLEKIPTGFLKWMQYMESLDLSNNFFLNLGRFPRMDKLQTLILDNCNILDVEKEAFADLTNLKELSLKWNNFKTYLPSAVMIPSLRSISFNGQKNTDAGQTSISIPEELFAPMTNLETLELVRFDFEHSLHGDLFEGLNNLKKLNLSYSSMPSIESDAMSLLPNLKTLIMPYCSGFDSYPFAALKGPQHLEILDLTSTQIYQPNSSDTHKNQNIGSVLKNVQVLNLSGSMLFADDAMELLGLEQMTELKTLDISKNPIRNWEQRKFSSALQDLKMVHKQNGYISLTTAMIEDFKLLSNLDLTENTFICNDQVPLFFELAENGENLTVAGWGHGYGYSCVEDPGGAGKPTTFFDYSSNGDDMNDSYDDDGNDFNPVLDKNGIIGLALGGVTLLAILSVLTNLVYQNWWTIQFKYARWKWQKSITTAEESETKNYDAFVSYSGKDSQWVNDILIPNLEPGHKLCIHERDFAIGQSINDNIIECLSTSNNCLIILSKNYLASKWCNFEAKIADSMMKERLTLIILEESVLTSKQLPLTIKTLLKTKTYITWNEKNSKFWRRIGKAILKVGNNYNNNDNVEETSS